MSMRQASVSHSSVHAIYCAKGRLSLYDVYFLLRLNGGSANTMLIEPVGIERINSRQSALCTLPIRCSMPSFSGSSESFSRGDRLLAVCAKSDVEFIL